MEIFNIHYYVFVPNPVHCRKFDFSLMKSFISLHPEHCVRNGNLTEKLVEALLKY
jgi:hypothetical protein